MALASYGFVWDAQHSFPGCLAYAVIVLRTTEPSYRPKLYLYRPTSSLAALAPLSNADCCLRSRLRLKSTRLFIPWSSSQSFYFWLTHLLVPSIHQSSVTPSLFHAPCTWFAFLLYILLIVLGLASDFSRWTTFASSFSLFSLMVLCGRLAHTEYC